MYQTAHGNSTFDIVQERKLDGLLLGRTRLRRKIVYAAVHTVMELRSSGAPNQELISIWHKRVENILRYTKVGIINDQLQDVIMRRQETNCHFRIQKKKASASDTVVKKQKTLNSTLIYEHHSNFHR